MATLLSALALVFPHGTAVITTPRSHVTVRIEIAETDITRGRGLMGRRSLPPRAGMLFVFGGDVRVAFWMRDTHIPLSVAFTNRSGRILRILDMKPCRADPCPLYDPKVTYARALEVNRGAFRRWGVRRGDRITLRR